MGARLLQRRGHAGSRASGELLSGQAAPDMASEQRAARRGGRALAASARWVSGHADAVVQPHGGRP
jgi:hypothetical protein